MISSACIEHLDFLHHLPDAEIFHPFEESVGRRHSFKSLTEVPPIPEISDKTVFDDQVRNSPQKPVYGCRSIKPNPVAVHTFWRDFERL